jgi:hypothetical protein
MRGLAVQSYSTSQNNDIEDSQNCRHTNPYEAAGKLPRRPLRYSLLFDASAHATMMVGRDDYLSVLQAIREHVKAYERRLEELEAARCSHNSRE